MEKSLMIAGIPVGPTHPLVLITGPCVIESEEHALDCAKRLHDLFGTRDTPIIFKASFDKANRTSLSSFRGPGLKRGLEILERIKKEVGFPITTDVHTVEQVEAVASVCDLIQIPAFLCRQTDLLVAAAQTGLPVSIKKGQFLAPSDMGYAVQKLRESGCNQILIIERGTTFGYQNLVCDFRSIPIMEGFGVPICFDGTHSVQLPGGAQGASGGERSFIPTLCKAAVAAGVSALFLETHPSPKDALCDAATQFPIDELPALIDTLEEIYAVIHQ